MLILGIDPGLGRCGYGFLDTVGAHPVAGDYGVIETKAEAKGKPRTTAERLVELEADMATLLSGERKPDAVAVEIFIPNPRLAHNAPMVLQARGVVLLLAQKAGIPIHEYRPNVVKQAVTGKGNAVKAEVQEAMAEALGIAIPRPDDAADALALAYVHHLSVEGGLIG